MRRNFHDRRRHRPAPAILFSSPRPTNNAFAWTRREVISIRVFNELLSPGASITTPGYIYIYTKVVIRIVVIPAPSSFVTAYRAVTSSRDHDRTVVATNRGLTLPRPFHAKRPTFFSCASTLATCAFGQDRSKMRKYVEFARENLLGEVSNRIFLSSRKETC